MKRRDKQIIKGLKKGDRQTLQYVYDTYSGLYQYIEGSNGGGREDSKDIFQ